MARPPLLHLLPLLLLAALHCAAAKNEPFANPPELKSSGGRLDVTLVVELAQTSIDGAPAQLALFNGSYVPPTLRLARGDTLYLTVVNRIAEQTNVHFHGFQVSPRDAADNSFFLIPATVAHTYAVPIPSYHRQGLYYYHSHSMNSEQQVFQGLAGLLVVDGLADGLGLAGVRELLLGVRDVQLSGGTVVKNWDLSGTSIRTVNGLRQPVLTATPGELMWWRVANIGANQYYNLTLDNPDVNEIGRDGGINRRKVPLALTPADPQILAPSQRREWLVRAPATAGDYLLHTQDVDLGAAGPKYSGEAILILRVQGSAGASVALPDDSEFPSLIDYGALGPTFINAQRQIQLSATLGAQYFIDGKPLDVTRTDIRVPLQAIEEWEIINLTQEHHVFHMHQLEFQVTQVNGQPLPFTGYDDTVDIPGLRADLSAQSATIRIAFDKLHMVGRFYYHCHVMRHEDNGMMAVLEVYDPNANPTTVPSFVGQSTASRPLLSLALMAAVAVAASLQLLLL